MNLAAMLDEAKAGTLGADDARRVGDQLREDPDAVDAYAAIYLLGLAGATSYRDVVEPFLDSPENPMLARIALQVLVNHWGLGGEYRDRVRELAHGLDWDDEDDVRHVALSAAGELARETADAELVGDLLATATGALEDELTRDIAFEALSRALGLGYDELCRPSRLPADDAGVASILERARALAGGAGEGPA